MNQGSRARVSRARDFLSVVDEMPAVGYNGKNQLWEEEIC